MGLMAHFYFIWTIEKTSLLVLTAASVRVETPSFELMCWTCFFTVLRLMNRLWAIWRLL